MRPTIKRRSGRAFEKNTGTHTHTYTHTRTQTHSKIKAHDKGMLVTVGFLGLRCSPP